MTYFIEAEQAMSSSSEVAMETGSGTLGAYRRNTSTSAGRQDSAAKRIFDIVVAWAILIVCAPLMLLIAGLVSCDGNSPFFAQPRVGRSGQIFYCLKFRTMVVNSHTVLHDHLLRNPDAAREWAETQKLRNDPRVTWIGAILRKWSLDELPQLINIIRAEMSLVGPRPIVTQEVSRYAENIKFYYAVRPGLTGLWQVSGRSDTSYDQRVMLDVSYVQNWSFVRDILIMLKTFPALITRKGAV